ncbi:N-acetylmuramoyl-L-alanine amidase [Clostridium oceanicum]
MYLKYLLHYNYKKKEGIVIRSTTVEKKSFVILFLTLFMSIFLYKSVYADSVTKELGVKTNVDNNYTWTITFNKDADKNTVNNDNIKVTDSLGNKVAVNLVTNEKTVKVTPVNFYKYSETYDINVENVKDLNGNSLLQKAHMSFIVKEEPQKPNPGVTICIDPGHGGRDPGAIGYSGVKEKDVTLKVGLKLGNILKQRGINVIYTRDTDIDLAPKTSSFNVSADLQKRCDISNAANAKYTISIHANSFSASSANGTETYYYEGSVEGKKLAEAVQKHIVEDLGTTNRGIKDGSWLYIAKHTTSATILTELGFLSNPEDERKLNSDSYQNKYANAIAKGVFEVLGM